MADLDGSWRRLVQLLGARVLPGVINLLTLLILTRALDPAQYGTYAVTLASAMVTSALSFHWLVQGISRFAFTYREERPRFVGTIGAGYCLASVVVVVVYPLAVLGSNQPIGATYILIGIGCLIALLGGLFDTVSALAVAEMRNTAYGRLALTKAAVTALSVYLLTQHSPQALTALYCVIAGLACAILLAHADARQLLHPKTDLSVLRRVSRQGIPLGVHYGLSMSLAFCDRLVVTYMLGMGATGYLAVTSDVVGQTLTMMMIVVHMTFFPLLIKAWESGGPADINLRFRTGFRLLVIIGLPSATCCMLFSANLAHLLMGEQFRATAQPLVCWVVTASLLSAFKLYYADLYFILEGKVLSLIPLSAAMLVISVTTNVFVLPSLGLEGAAMVMAGIQAFGLTVSWVRARRRFPVPFDWRIIGMTVALCIAASLIASPLRMHVGLISGLLQALFWALICACAHWLTKRYT